MEKTTKNYKRVGEASIDGSITSIRKYDNGMYIIEIDGNVKYSSNDVDELQKLLDLDSITYRLYTKIE